MSKLTPSQVESAKNLACEKCSCEVMKQVFVIKTISGLLTGEAKDTFVPLPLFACNACSHVNELFAKELKLYNRTEPVTHVQV